MVAFPPSELHKPWRQLLRLQVAFLEDGGLDAATIALALSDYQRLAPALVGHPHARAQTEAVDVDFVLEAHAASLLHFGEVLPVCALGFSHLSLRTDDAHWRSTTPAGAVPWMLGIALEQAKLKFGLPIDEVACAAHQVTPEQVAAVLQQAPTHATFAPAVPAPDDDNGAPNYIVVGDAARIAHQLLSPYAYRLGKRMRQLGLIRPDDVFAHLAQLHQQSPATEDERLTAEHSEGLVPTMYGVQVRAEQLNTSSVDKRITEVAIRMARQKARVWLVTSSQQLHALLATARPVEAVLVGVNAQKAGVPAYVHDAVRNTVLPIRNILEGAAGVVVDVPSSNAALAETMVSGVSDVWRAVYAAKAHGHVPDTCKHVCALAPGDAALAAHVVGWLTRLFAKPGR